MNNFEETLQFRDNLLAYAKLLTNNFASAEDLVQETYAHAFIKWKLYVNGNLNAWLKRMMYNLFVNKYRKERKLTIGNSEGLCEVQAKPIPCHISSKNVMNDPKFIENLSDKTVEALKSLKPNFRKILLGRAINDMSYKEISLKFKIPVGTVMSRLGRAREHMRTYIEENGCLK